MIMKREERPDYVACFIRKNTALAIVLLFTSGATVGWISRGFHDNDWRIGSEPTRWHPATLVDVVDGDTIKVKWDTQVTSVRMLNINTPERGQPGYREATDNLKSMLNGETAVMLEFEKDGSHARGKFGRLLCYVWLNGKNLNVEQVRAGHSRFYTKYGAGRYPAEFRGAMLDSQQQPAPSSP
jgi:endonuclease YncB( thermonuclease family)